MGVACTCVFVYLGACGRGGVRGGDTVLYAKRLKNSRVLAGALGIPKHSGLGHTKRRRGSDEVSSFAVH